MKELISRLAKMFFQEHQFTFRFDEYDGSEIGNQIYDTNVVQYEFINAGESIVTINAGLKIYPQSAGIPPYRVKLRTNYNENDVTIYQYGFTRIGTTNCTIGLGSGVIQCNAPAVCNYTVAVTFDGNPVNTPFVIQCTMTPAQIQALWDANLLPAYSYFHAVFSWTPNLFMSVTGTFPFGSGGKLIFLAVTNDGEAGCQNNSEVGGNLQCTFTPQLNRLIVISKVRAKTRARNHSLNREGRPLPDSKIHP